MLFRSSELILQNLNLIVIYCENIVNVTLFFFTLPRFRNHFFFSPIFGNAIATIVTIFFPYFGNGIVTISLSIFFFSFHFGHSTHTSHTRAAELGRGISISTLPKFNIFSPPFSSSLSYFWLNFSNSNTEILLPNSAARV